MKKKSACGLFSLEGRVALVTGGSRGLGLQMAKALGEAGASVILTSRNPKDLEESCHELVLAGIDASWLAADCANESACETLVTEALSRTGRIDILLNNAGANWSSPAEDHPVAAWDKVMNLNLRGYFVLAQQVGKRSMIPRRFGRIINVSSISGLNGNPAHLHTLAYNTSKTAVLGLTKALAAEWGQFNITVNAICPGFFSTRMSAGWMKQAGEDNIAQFAPLKRLGDDEDLKGVTLLYASEAGKHITGQWLAVDGGSSIVLNVG